MKRQLSLGLGVALATVLATGSVWAQAGLPPQTRPGIGTQPSSQQKDQQIAEWVAADTHVSSETAALAKDHASSDKVKEFAKNVRKEHQDACEKLKQAAPGATVSFGNGNADDSHALQTRTGQRGGNAGFDASEMKKKIADKRVKLIKEEFQEHDGDKFDKAFLGVQALQHQNLVAALEVMEQEASPQLRDVLKSKRETAKKHCEKAKELMKELGDS